MKDSGMSIFQKKEKNTLELSFLSPEQVASEMDELVKHYGTDLSNADLKATRRILGKVSSLNKELSDMRAENR